MLHEQKPKDEKAGYKQQDPLNSRNGKKKGQGQDAWGESKWRGDLEGHLLA